MSTKLYRKTMPIPIIVLVGFFLIIQGCATKWVADYDAVIAQEVVTVSKQVDRFYGELIETEESERKCIISIMFLHLH